MIMTDFHLKTRMSDKKVIYHPLCSMTNFVANKVATRWGTRVSLYRVIGYHVSLWEGHMIVNHPLYGVIGYHVTHIRT